jgi:hypothetical protein
MAKPVRRVPTNGADRYIVSEQNPNDTCGGHCACGQHPPDQHGPFIVFAAEAAPHAGRRVQVVVCAPCAKSAVVAIERGDEVARVGAGGAEDRAFDGGEPDQTEDYQALKARYEKEAVGTSLLELPSFDEWLAAQGAAPRAANLVRHSTTGIDPNATSLVQARADTSPVGVRGGPVYGRTDDPVEQLSNPDNWGTPEPTADES